MEAGKIQEWVSRGNLILVGTGRLRPAGDKNAWHTVRPTQVSAISDNVQNSHLSTEREASPTAPRSPSLGSWGRRVDKSREQPKVSSLQFFLSHSCLEVGALNPQKKVCC